MGSGEASTFFASHTLAVPALGNGTTLKVGPSFRREAGGATQIGLRAVVERYRPKDWGSVFLLGDLNSIKTEYLLLAEWSFAPSNLSLSVSFQGDARDFSEQSVAIGYRIPDTPLRLRLGHKFRNNTTFVGFSINTF